MSYTTPLSQRPSVYVISASRMFERAAYYGLRSLLIIYMIGETVGYETHEAIKVYSIFTGALVFTRIVGAVLGDLLIGSKVSMVIGVFLQALGAFSLSISSPPFLYAGLGLILLGGGLYSPNVLALYGKQYLDRKNLADSGFMLFYVAVSLGAGLGIYFTSLASEISGFSLGFIMSGILFVIAGVLAIFSKDAKAIPEEKLGISVTNRTIGVIAAIVIVAVFWWIYELSGIKMREIQESLSSIADNPITTEMWQMLNPIATIIGGIILIFAWRIFNISQYIKFGLGFLAVALAMVVLYLFPPAQNSSHILMYGGALLFLSLAELLVAPTVYATIAKYVNPKYMAMVMCITFIPSLVFASISGIFGEVIYQNPDVVLLFCMAVAILFGIGMFVLQLVIKDRPLYTEEI